MSEKKPEPDKMFRPHPNLAPEVNAAIEEGELQGGVEFAKLASGTELEIQTKNHIYTILFTDPKNRIALISGHPEICPTPVSVTINGSTLSHEGSMLSSGKIVRGQFLEFVHPEHKVVRTSKIQEIKEISKPPTFEE